LQRVGIPRKMHRGPRPKLGELFEPTARKPIPALPFQADLRKRQHSAPWCCPRYSSPKYLFCRRLFVRELAPRFRFYSVAREKRRDEEAAMQGSERKSRFFLVLLLMGCMSLTGMTLAAQQSGTVQDGAPASGAVPNLIRYSGVLRDASGAVLTTLSGVTFLIYRDEQGGPPLWMETQNVQPDKAGRYTVQLGAVSKGGLPADVFMTGE